MPDDPVQLDRRVAYGLYATTTFEGGFRTDVKAGWKAYMDRDVRPAVELAMERHGRTPDFILVHLTPQYGTEHSTGYTYDAFERMRAGEIQRQAGFNPDTREPRRIDPPEGPYGFLVDTLGDLNALADGSFLRAGRWPGGVRMPLYGYVGPIMEETVEEHRQHGDAAYIERLEANWRHLRKVDWDVVIVDLAGGYRVGAFDEHHPGVRWLADKAKDPDEPVIGVESLPQWVPARVYRGCPAVALSSSFPEELADDSRRKRPPLKGTRRFLSLAGSPQWRALTEEQVAKAAEVQADWAIGLNDWTDACSRISSLNVRPRVADPVPGIPSKAADPFSTVPYEEAVKLAFVRRGSPTTFIRSGDGPWSLDWLAKFDRAGDVLQIRPTRSNGDFRLTLREDGSLRLSASNTLGGFHTLAETRVGRFEIDSAEHRVCLRLSEHGVRSAEVYVDGEFVLVDTLDTDSTPNRNWATEQPIRDRPAARFDRLTDLQVVTIGGTGPVDDVLEFSRVLHPGYVRGLAAGPTQQPTAILRDSIHGS